MTEHPKPRLPLSRRWQAGLAAVALLAVGGGAGAVVGHAMQPPVEMAPIQPVAIRTLPSQSGVVSIRARVLEVYGNKFVAGDATGRTLVDLGRGGDDAALVAGGQTVTVQGRYDRSLLRASFLVDASNKIVALGPLGGPPHDRHGPGGPEGHHGPRGAEGRDGPGGPRDAAPPPPPPADDAVPPPAPATGA